MHVNTDVVVVNEIENLKKKKKKRRKKMGKKHFKTCHIDWESDTEISLTSFRWFRLSRFELTVWGGTRSK